jgi:archaellum biogenesis ATPase FlaH
MKLKEYLKDDQRNALPCRMVPEDYLNRNRSEEYVREWESIARICLEKELEKVILKCNQWKQGLCDIPEDHVEEIVHHCSTAFAKSQHFFGRKELLQTALEKIRTFKIDRAKNKLFSGISLALIGKSGCGKTALMSKLALSLYQEDLPVIIRFCGTSKYSLSGLKLIQSISLQLLATYRKFEVEAMVVLLPTQEYKAAVEQFLSLISRYPVFLFIDSLDQLENRNEERSKLSFLRDIRPHDKSRIIVSTLPDEYDDHGKRGKYFYQCERILKDEQVSVTEVGPIDHIGITIHGLLDSRRRGITSDQWNVVLNAANHEPTILYISI